MQKTPTSTTTPIFATSIFNSTSSSSRPTTRDGGIDPLTTVPSQTQQNSNSNTTSHPLSINSSGSNSTNLLAGGPSSKDRKPSFTSRKTSLSTSRRRGSSISNVNAYVTDAATPPALPNYALSAAAKIAPRADGGRESDTSAASMAAEHRALSRSATGASYLSSHTPGVAGLSGTSVGSAAMWQQTEAGMVHQHITEVANKRISTLDYLRKAHEGRVYWFNTYLFDKPDFNRMPYFDDRKLGRKATNYLLLGLSLPTIVDLYSSSPLEFLRSLNALLSEFDSFQSLHGDASTSLTRARLPNMFRRQGGKSRRSTSGGDMHPPIDESYPAPPPGTTTPSVMNFAQSESDLLPGEEYTHLLTPSLPFDPDYFETFATLCDVLIDCYTMFLALVPSSKETSAPVAELFAKADSKVRKIIVQGVVKEFEDHSRTHIKGEVGNLGKVVLGGLM